MEEDEPIRQSIRDNLSIWRKKLDCDKDAVKKLQYKLKFVKELKTLPIAIETDIVNEQHYEVDTEFFKIVLGARKKYSSTFFPNDNTTLDEAEDAMLQLVCDRAKLVDGMVVMDLGCGWGVTGIWICEKYPKCKVTCISNSSTQAKYINDLAADKGYSARLNCITADANTFLPSIKYDRIISIEMFEHMKNYEQLMSRVASWLKPDGCLFTQILCHREYCYHFKRRKNDNETEWMAKHFFTGGTMPSSDLFLYFQKELTIEDHWNINGSHYSKTLEAWLNRLDANRDKVLDVFRHGYGEDAEKQVFNWRMFFIYCSEAFAFDGGNDWLVSHHLFRKKQNTSKL